LLDEAEIAHHNKLLLFVVANFPMQLFHCITFYFQALCTPVVVGGHMGAPNGDALQQFCPSVLRTLVMPLASFIVMLADSKFLCDWMPFLTSDTH